MYIQGSSKKWGIGSTDALVFEFLRSMQIF